MAAVFFMEIPIVCLNGDYFAKISVSSLQILYFNA